MGLFDILSVPYQLTSVIYVFCWTVWLSSC